jgi:hypothetical protein
MQQPAAAKPAIAQLQGRSFRQMTTDERTSGSVPQAEQVDSSAAGTLPVLFSLPSLIDSDSLTSGKLAISGQSEPAAAALAGQTMFTTSGSDGRWAGGAAPLVAAAAEPSTGSAAWSPTPERQPTSVTPSTAGLSDWLSHWSGGLGLVVSLLLLMVVGIVFIRGARVDSSANTARLMEELSDHLADQPLVQLPDSQPSGTAVAARSLADQQAAPPASGRLISQLRERYGSEPVTGGSATQQPAPERLESLEGYELPDWGFDFATPQAAPQHEEGTRAQREVGESIDGLRSDAFRLEPLGPAVGLDGSAPLGDQGYDLPAEWGPMARLGQPTSQPPAAGSGPAGRLEGVEADAAVVSRSAVQEPTPRRTTEPTAGRIYTETEYAHLSVQELLALRQQAQQQLARGSAGPGAASQQLLGDSLSPPLAGPGYHSAARPTGEAGSGSGQPSSQGFGDQPPLSHPSLTR